MNTLVVHQRDESAIPFLRGILTRSLLDAGMEFDPAYVLATRVRDDLSQTPEVTAELLHERVLELLVADGELEVAAAYQSPMAAPAIIEVQSLSGGSSAFSRGRHALYLRSSGMKPDRAEQTTSLFYEHLLAAGISSITTCELGYLTWLCLNQEVSKKAAHRYLVWAAFQRSARPLLLMICGTVGSGKSTISAELSHLLDIVRTQSTDMLREVMRMMIPQRLMPVLHESSFNAWMALPSIKDEAREQDTLVVDGFRSQAELLTVPCEAVMQRAIEESVPLILEGVHAHPELVRQVPEDSDAIVVHITLAVLKRKELKARLRGRGVEVPLRRAKRYFNRMGSIWSLQSYLLSEADRCDTTIITNRDKEKCILQIVRQVNYELAQQFGESPDSVFDVSSERWPEMDDDTPWQELMMRLANP